MRKRVLMAALLLALAPVGRTADRQQEKEPPTQELETFPEPPAAVTAEAGRLAFHVSPLSSKGLLSQQVRDGLRVLLGQAGNGSIVKLRAFVAGSGDTRRVAAILSETMTGRKLPLPALTVAQVGALPAPGVQVVMEATIETRRAVNPNGLAFFSVERAEHSELEERLAPLAGELLPKLRAALSSAGLDGKDVLRATCYVSSVEDVWEVRTRVAREFPKAVVNFVQPERNPAHASAGCEMVARLRAPLDGPTRVLAREAGRPAAGVLVGPARVVFTGGQLAFGFRDEDAKLAVERLERTMGQRGSSLRQSIYVGYYVLSRGVAEMAERSAAGRFDPAGLPAGTLVNCVGLPSIDASFSMEAIGLTAGR
jgi:enamine deaminase RidA (YjgF/YER057c/UK114 family)